MAPSAAVRRGLAERLAAEYGLSEQHAKAKPSVLDDIFEVEPVPLDVFIKDKNFLGQPFGLSPVQFEIARHFEQVLFPETYLKMVEEFGEEWSPVRFVNELVVEIGKGGGKDFVLQICFARVAYLMLTLKTPQTYFGMATNSQIHFLNVAYSAPQAQGSFFKPLRNLLVSSPFFADKYETDVPGPQAVSIRFEKQLELISGHSDADGLEGKNLLAAVADEISAFPTIDLNRSGKPPARSADSIIDMLRSSASTRFPYTHKVAQISYPRSAGDAIQRARAEAEEDIAENGGSSTFYVSGPHRTWEANPIYARNGKWVTLPGMDYPIPDAPKIVSDYKKRRKYAEAKYECRPSATSNPYYKDTEAIHRSFSQPVSDPPPLQIEYAYGTDAASGEAVPSWQASFRANDLRPIPGAIYAIHADMAVTGDRAGIAMSHVKEWREVETSEADGLSIRLERRPVVKVDFAHAFEADAEAVAPDGSAAPRSIQIRWFRKLVLFLADMGFVFGSVSLDGFQCLSGDTLIPRLGGDAVPLSELAEMEDPGWVYSIKDGKVVPGKAVSAFVSGHEDVYDVLLDNGEKVRATAGHRFMLRDGSYKMVSELEEGESLMPLYRRKKKVSPTSREYEQVWHPGESSSSARRWRFTHSAVSKFLNGPTPKGSVVHHVDCNPLNNTPDNLRVMTSSDHSSLHQAMASAAGHRFRELWKDETWATNQREVISSSTTASNLRRVGTFHRKDLTVERIAEVHASRKRAGLSLSARAIAAELGCSYDTLHNRVKVELGMTWNEFRISLGDAGAGVRLASPVKVPDVVACVSDYISEFGSPPTSTEVASRLKCSKVTLFKSLKRDSASFSEIVSEVVAADCAPKNHKVVSVTFAGNEKVYDLEVEDHHNFAVGAGVFVHNSVDTLQILAARGFPAQKISVDRTNEAWETLGDLMYEGRIEGPNHALLKRELEGLTPSGRKVDHPNTPDASKDVADAVAASATQAVLLGGQEEVEGSTSSVDFFTVGSPFDTFGAASAGLWGADEIFSDSAWSGDSTWP